MQYLTIALVLTIFGTVSIFCESTKVRFDDYHVYQLNPQTEEQLEVIKKLESYPDFYIFLDGVHYLNSKINVMVAPQTVPGLVKSLTKNSIPYDLVDTNAQASLEDDVVADANRRTSDYSWKEYHQLNDTYNWLHILAHKHKEVKVFVAGETYEKRQILGIKISFSDEEKKIIFLEGGMHAREWIGPAVLTFIVNELLTSKKKEVRMMAENFDWYIVPHANPDGYEYTHTTNRVWRKTRTPYGKCQGADPNRNFDVHWNEIGTSNNPCSDTYAGPHALSEIETKSLFEFITTNLKHIFLYISFHSYSQLLLFPYGYTNQSLPPNYSDYNRMYKAAIEAIAKLYGTKYDGGNIFDAIYPAAGSTTDSAVVSFNAKYAFCYELRPSKNAIWTGFKLPADQIIPTGEETMESVMALIKEAGAPHFL